MCFHLSVQEEGVTYNGWGKQSNDYLLPPIPVRVSVDNNLYENVAHVVLGTILGKPRTIDKRTARRTKMFDINRSSFCHPVYFAINIFD